jgi:hypothetical protein
MAAADGDLCWFITLTLNGEQFARDDARTALNKLQAWLRNKVQRNGLKYIIVPEYHKDGRSIHFHGLINGALDMVPSGTYIRPEGGKPVKAETIRRSGGDLEQCKPVYNIPAWDYGFTTAIHVYGERTSAAAYVCKYITKEADYAGGDVRKIGGRYFLHSSNIRQPYVLYGYADFDAAEGEVFVNPGCKVKISLPSFTEFCNNAFSTINGTPKKIAEIIGREAETDNEKK